MSRVDDVLAIETAEGRGEEVGEPPGLDRYLDDVKVDDK